MLRGRVLTDPFFARAKAVAVEYAVHCEHTVEVIRLMLDQFRKRAVRLELYP